MQDSVRNSEMYKGIVRKLGFEPKDYVPDFGTSEDDREKDNPFKHLTYEENDFLLKNECLV